MNKLFCTNCGQKNIYQIEKPKFCVECGVQIGTAVLPILGKGSSQKVAKKMTKLAVEIEGGGRLKLGEVMSERRPENEKYPETTQETRLR